MAVSGNGDSGRKAAMRAAVALAIFGGLTGAIFLADPAGFYLWAKAIHVIAVIAWMAGMLYLPRLFIYHCAAEKGSVQSETFKVMEGRLLRVIINPAMTIAWAFGLWLAWEGSFYRDHWFEAKFLGVVAMSAVHGYFALAVRRFAEDRNPHSEKFWRLMNELPTVLMIAVVILVVVRPF